MASFPEFISRHQRPIPWAESESVVNLRAPFSESDATVVRFLVASASEILKDLSVVADIDKRLRSGSGISRSATQKHVCSSGSCPHNESEPISFLDQLIKETVSNFGLGEIVVKAVKDATKTRLNVIDRGRKSGEKPMDRSTDAYIRRTIWTESLVREIVSSVHKKYAEAQSKMAKEGFLFAIPSLEMLQADSRKFERISSDQMCQLMVEGITVVSDFFKADQEMLSELDRLDALAVFDEITVDRSRTDAVYWSTLQGLGTGPLRDVCERISFLPFELNMKNKSLMLQTCQYFQISMFQAQRGKQEMHVDNRNNGRKISCIFPITFESNVPVLMTKSGKQIFYVPGDLILLDSHNCEYMCPISKKKRFQISAFFTGPIN